MYHVIENLHTLCELLHDEQSKDIFKAKLAYDVERSIPNADRFSPKKARLPFLGWPQPHKETLKKLNQENKKMWLSL